MKTKLILYSIILLTAGFVHSQNACRIRISGRVLSASDSTPVKQAEIFVENGHKKTLTAETGYFEMQNLCPGELEFEIDADSFVHRHFKCTLQKDSQFILFIEPRGQYLNKINIEKHITNPLLAKDQGITYREPAKSLAEQLEILPGVRNLKSGNTIAKPIIQGLSGMRVPIFVNGIKQNGQQWGSDHGPEANATGFDAFELISGASILKFCSEATGGLIELRNEKSAHEGETDISSGLGYEQNGNQVNFFSKLLFKPALKHTVYFGNLGFREAGNYHTPDHILRNTGLKEMMFTGGLHYEKNKKAIWADGSLYLQEAGIYSGSHISTVSDLLSQIRQNTPVQSPFTYSIGLPKQQVLHGQIRFKYTGNGNYFIAALQQDERKEFDFHRSGTVKFPQLNIGLSSATYQWGRTFLNNPYAKFDAGIQGIFYLNKFGGFYFIPDFRALNQAAYLLCTIKKPVFQHTLAVRSEYFGSSATANSGYIHISESGQQTGTALAWTGEFTAGKTRIKLDAARLFRFPWFNELYSSGVHHGAAAYEKGNPALKKEISWKSACSLNYSGKKSSIFTSMYCNLFQNFINLVPDSAPVLTIRGAFPAYSYQQFNALFSGIDFQWNYQILAHTEIKAVQSFVYGRNLENHTYPAYIPPARTQVSISQSVKKYAFSLQQELVFCQKFYTPGTDYLPPPPAYYLMHMKITRNSLFKKQNFQLILGADNLLNTRYRNYLDRFRYFTNMPGRNIYVRMVWNYHHHNEKNTIQNQ